MCLFRKCDETVVSRLEVLSPTERAVQIGGRVSASGEMAIKGMRRQLVTTIKCNACGRVRIDQRSV